jgi:hypothetical protein
MMMNFLKRDRRLLQTAHEKGYLNGRNRHSRELLNTYGGWCWRLKLPVIWIERQTPRSKYGRVFLDMFTTPNVLTPAGKSEMKKLLSELSIRGDGAISAHDMSWNKIPLANLEAAARKTLRISTRLGYCALDTSRVANNSRRRATSA